ncbi:MAG: class I SAM-dependent methyltransferase [Erythrobacter sp.]|uniref:class I SAM-dependent methyltransferase n=1 Tax=Erythrobacter sp. TaxID=1042 RepID=UPI003296F10A
MFNRRNVLSTAAYGSVFAWLFGSRQANAATEVSGEASTGIAKQGPAKKVVELMPNADLAGRMDFHAGFLGWSINDFERTSSARLDSLLREKGVNPDADVDLIPLLDDIRSDPVMAMRMRTWLSNQHLMLGGLEASLGLEADRYFDEMEAAEARHPERIELNPDMKMPTYAKHEIHLQKGGYVGNPLAGYVNYHYGNILYEALFGSNIQDQRIAQMANAVPLPEDGEVGRALDMGCGTGRLAYGLKNRFPNAEVTGIDIAGPMVRFSHKRAVDLEIDCTFAQRNAESTGYPDNHFDVIASNILHHEIDAAATDNVIAEAFRILRPGGVFYPIDHATGKQAPQTTAKTKFWAFNDRAINNEVWRDAFESRDFAELVRKAGFVVDESLRPAVWGTGSIKAVKPA